MSRSPRERWTRSSATCRCPQTPGSSAYRSSAGQSPRRFTWSTRRSISRRRSWVNARRCSRSSSTRARSRCRSCASIRRRRPEKAPTLPPLRFASGARTRRPRTAGGSPAWRAWSRATAAPLSCASSPRGSTASSRRMFPCVSANRSTSTRSSSSGPWPDRFRCTSTAEPRSISRVSRSGACTGTRSWSRTARTPPRGAFCASPSACWVRARSSRICSSAKRARRRRSVSR